LMMLMYQGRLPFHSPFPFSFIWQSFSSHKSKASIS
jgi:hypothetical protein